MTSKHFHKNPRSKQPTSFLDGVSIAFSRDIRMEEKKLPTQITNKDLKGREDFRRVLTFTVDPAEAKDFDDAISFKQLEEDRFEVGVHIADVTHYVKPHTHIDKEAYNRGTSIYLVDQVIPMLPEKLCNDLCSLKPDTDRLCIGVIFDIDSTAQIKSCRIKKTIIHSQYRFAYEEVQKRIDVGNTSTDIDFAIVTLNNLAQQRKNARHSKGAIDFATNEVTFTLNAKKRPIQVHTKTSTPANQLIEEFMLLANEAVATAIGHDKHFWQKRPFVYRIHEMPPHEKQLQLATMVKQFGYSYKPAKQKAVICKNLNSLLDKCKTNENHTIIEKLVLKTMSKACYSTQNIGHYGLLMDFYTHFTSPIRRYPDIMVHRLLDHYLLHLETEAKDLKLNTLEEACEHCSNCEQVAVDLERKSIKLTFAEYYSKFKGQYFDGVISGITDFGIFVDMLPDHAEGLVPMRLLERAIHEQLCFDQDQCCLKEIYSGKIVFTLGKTLRVKLLSTNPEKGWIDLDLATNKVLVTQRRVPNNQFSKETAKEKHTS